MSRLVAYDFATLVTAVNYDVAALRIGQGTDRAEYSAALVCSVTGIYIHVKRAKAERTVVARGVAKGQNLTAAVLTYEA